ncbi:lactonase family protein [Enterococcus sp. CSURQ0835]|uniref:lactonase family protein n=1 Tax=Enterococcus sp. CSURQ0835 TaxID=2681394 RepID=UPI0013598E57|nr:lactonase family protein [Enterococcus sp. CSURQ0835]
MKILLGTYTRRKSEGIYQIELDPHKKQLTELTLLHKETSPTYLTKSNAGNLYTVTTVKEQGGAAAYDSNGNFLNAVTEKGAPLCYVAVDEKRQLLYGANYHKGEINVYHLQSDGSLASAAALYHVEKTGPNKNQDAPHVHYTDLTPDERLVVCDLGTDLVSTYDIFENGELGLKNFYRAEPGTGPRHLVFHPNGTLAYLLGELDSSVTVLAYNHDLAEFTQVQKLSALPSDYTGENGGAAIRITQDGKFLYTSNRGHDSIAVFEIAADGTLKKIQTIATEGNFPRDFALDPSEQFIVCANQNSDNLTLFSRDAQTGKLTVSQKDVYAPECVCVYFEE